MAQIEIPLYDEFDNKSGKFSNYDCYDQVQLNQLANQQHVDIRTFYPPTSVPINMGLMDTLGMDFLDTESMGALEGFSNVQVGETWSLGTIGPQADRNNWYGLRLDCQTGTNVTDGVLPAIPPDVDNLPVDLSGLLNPSGHTSVAYTFALPNFPLASIDLANSVVQFALDPDLSYGDGVSFTFDQSVTTLGNGDSEMRLVGLLESRTSIYGVRLTIVATAPCTFRCLAIRAVTDAWVYAPLDYNTVQERIVPPVSVDGSLPTNTDFPTATAPITPTNWPFLYRSTSPSGAADPRPIDLSTAAIFNTGSLINAAGAQHDVLTLHYREISLDEFQQLDLDGGTFPQSRLDGLGHQPDFGLALFDSRTQQELDDQTQENLDTQTQFSLERVQDFLSQAFLQVMLKWNSGEAILSVTNQDGLGYTFSDLILNPNTAYVLLVDLVENSIRARIFSLDDQLVVTGDSVYDTTTIIDDSFVHRRKGRFGWYSQLLDGDAWIESIRTRGVVFGEYRSPALLSDTPVAGGQIFTQATPDRDLVHTLVASPWGGTITADNTKTFPSGHGGSPLDDQIAFKLVTRGALQGAITNTMYLDDFEHTYIEFDLWFPSEGLETSKGVNLFLLGKLRSLVQLFVPIVMPDQWQHIKIELASLETLNVATGPYALVIGQAAGNTSVTWWIDNLLVNNRVVAWRGRGQKQDPWTINAKDWVPFKETANTERGGILFATRGDTMQVQALARRQNAVISGFKITPKYAELGRFVWPNQFVTPSPIVPPSLVINNVAGRKVTLSKGVTDPATMVCMWTFGDGTFDYGNSVTHTYEAPGTYSVTLTTLAKTGVRNSATDLISIL